MSAKYLRPLALALLLIAALSAVWSWRTPPPRLSISSPQIAEDFTLLDHAGISHSLRRMSKEKAIVIVTQQSGCKALDDERERLRDLRDSFGPRGVRFFMANSRHDDTRAVVIGAARKFNLDIPILIDPVQIVPDTLGLTRCAEAAVINTGDWGILYRGNIAGVEDSLRALLAGDFSTRQGAESSGDLIALRRREIVSYQRQIAPLFATSCYSCHGGTYPVNLGSYDAIKKAKHLVRNSIRHGSMPPFWADPHYGPYRNDTSLTPQQQASILDWIDSGMPFDGRVDTLPNVIESDKVSRQEFRELTMPPVFRVEMKHPAVIPAMGDTEYRYFEMPQRPKKDLWIKGFQVHVKSDRQLRHATLLIVQKPLDYFRTLAARHDFKDRCFDSSVYLLGAFDLENKGGTPVFRTVVWSPERKQPHALPHPHTAIHIPKDSYLILETFWRGVGKPTYDQVSIDFFGYDKPWGNNILQGIMLSRPQLDVPAGVASLILPTQSWRPDRPIFITNMVGHMHLRGRSISFYEKRASGVERKLASITNFHYGLLNNMGMVPYDPIAIDAGSEIYATCEFDNSAYNKGNPDPYNPVRMGFMITGTEMCHISLVYYEKTDGKRRPSRVQ